MSARPGAGPTVQQLAASHNHGQGDDHDHESNTGLWHRVGELFNREQIRQRKIKHGKADAVENGPKEISIFCPNDPTIKIVDLSEDERNRDECLVLNIAAPDVSSRIVLFCNAHSLDDEEDEDADDDDDGFSERMCSLASCEDRSFDLAISSTKTFLRRLHTNSNVQNCTTLHIETE